MTQHRKIDPAKGTPLKSSNVGRASLFERADAEFGLGRMNTASVPGNLPKIDARAASPSRRAPSADLSAATQAPDNPAAIKSSPTAPPREAAPEPKTVLSGPFQPVDRSALREAGLIVPEDPVTGLLEEFRIVKRELLSDARASGNARARRILVCSPHSGEGKTFCAANLAIALAAERDVEVLLIDADVLKPSVTRRFDLEGGPGIMDAIADTSVRPESLAIRTDIEGLFIMPAGTSSARDAEYLASARTGDVLDRLTRGAANRYLIFDTPPALAASPAAELAGHVGQAMLVVRADQTGRAALEDAQQLLSACPDIKLLLNAVQFSPSGRRFGDYGEQEED